MEKKPLSSMEAGFWIGLGASLILFMLDMYGKKDKNGPTDQSGEQNTCKAKDLDGIVCLDELTIDELASADVSTAELQELMEDYVSDDTKESYQKAAQIRDLINTKKSGTAL